MSTVGTEAHIAVLDIKRCAVHGLYVPNEVFNVPMRVQII